MADRLAHRPRAGRSWCVRARDRAPAPSSRRRRFSSRRGYAPEAAHARAANARRRARPSRRASNGRARSPAGRRFAPGDRAAGDRRIWRRAHGRRSLRSAGRPRSAAPAPALARRRPRRRGRRIWAGASPARGTAPARYRAARRRPRRSGEARPCSTGRPCRRCRRSFRCAADAPAARRGSCGAGARLPSGPPQIGFLSPPRRRLASARPLRARAASGLRAASRRDARSDGAATP